MDNRDDTDIEGVDSDKDNNSDTDKDDSDIERIDSDKAADKDSEDRSEVIYELLTLNPLSNRHPASSPF